MSYADRTPITPAEYIEYRQRFRNWGRWGDDDQLGTLNHITPEVRRHAANLVRNGHAISCANPVATAAVWPEAGLNNSPADHRMRVGEAGSSDYIGLSYHGLINTHIDALCHMFTADGGAPGTEPVLYNGRPRALVTEAGALSHSIDRWRNGVVTRGVLYDIPRERGIPHITADAPIEGWHLEDFARAHGIEPRAGDAVLIRSGFDPFWAAHPDFTFDGQPRTTPGVAASALEFLHAHDTAVLGWDLQEAMGQGLPERIPIHRIAIPYMGMALLDNANFEALAQACAETGRYEFLFTIAPLVVIGGTGSPVNPIAVL